MALIIALRNISALAPVSDYEYTVFINDTVIEKGSVKGHTRADGWDVLMMKLLDQRVGELPCDSVKSKHLQTITAGASSTAPSKRAMKATTSPPSDQHCQARRSSPSGRKKGNK